MRRRNLREVSYCHYVNHKLLFNGSYERNVQTCSHIDLCIVEVTCLLIISKSAIKPSKFNCLKVIVPVSIVAIYGIILHKLLCLKWELPTNKFTEDFSIWANLIVSHMIWFVIMLIHLMLLFANPSTVLENVLFLRTMLSFSPFIIPHTSLSLAYVKCGIIFYIVLWSKSLLLLFTCMFYHLLHVFYQFLSMECNILYYVWIFILK